MDIGIGLILIGALIAVLAGLFMKGDKERRMNTIKLGAIILVVGIVVYGFTSGYFKLPEKPAAVAPTPEAPTVPEKPEVPEKPTACLGIEDTTVTLYAHNKYTAGTSLSNEWHRVFILGSDGNWVDLGLKKDGDSFTVSPGDVLRVIFAENSTSYYSREVIKTVPCKGTYNLEVGLAPYDSSPTVTIWLEDGSVMSSSNQQAMGADSTYTLPMKYKASAKKAAGSPYHPGKGNILCIQANQTVFQDFIVMINGEEAEAAKVPRALSAAAGKEEWCYYIPVVENTGEATWDLVVETASTEPADADDPSYYIYDVDIDLDADTLETINDVEDEDFNDLGYSGYIASGTIYVS